MEKKYRGAFRGNSGGISGEKIRINTTETPGRIFVWIPARTTAKNNARISLGIVAGVPGWIPENIPENIPNGIYRDIPKKISGRVRTKRLVKEPSGYSPK